jgi:hypothetical protein
VIAGRRASCAYPYPTGRRANTPVEKTRVFPTGWLPKMAHLGDGSAPSSAYDGPRRVPEEGSTVGRGKRDAWRCGHDRPVLVDPVEGGRVARCLACGQSGPVRPTSGRALAALREEARRSFRETA